MFFRFIAASAALAACAGLASAQQLEILSPGGPNLWWVASSQNTLMWDCQQSPYENFTILIANSNPAVLAAPLAIIAVEENYQCSQSITQQQSAQPAATGYTIQLADTLNNTNVYATSQPFEIKALGATYPPSSATPTGTSTATSSGASGTGSASSTSSSSSKSGAAVTVSVPLALGLGSAVGAAAMGVLML